MDKDTGTSKMRGPVRLRNDLAAAPERPLET